MSSSHEWHTHTNNKTQHTPLWTLHAPCDPNHPHTPPTGEGGEHEDGGQPQQQHLPGLERLLELAGLQRDAEDEEDDAHVDGGDKLPAVHLDRAQVTSLK